MRSGWAVGQRYLNGGAAVIDAALGKGRGARLRPGDQYRGQPHGTFKFLFNAILYPTATIFARHALQAALDQAG